MSRYRYCLAYCLFNLSFYAYQHLSGMDLKRSRQDTTKIYNCSFSIQLFIDVNAKSANEHIELLTQVLKDEVDVQGKRGFHTEGVGLP